MAKEITQDIEKFIEKQSEPMAGSLHLIGAILAIAALVILVKAAAETGEPKKIVSFTIFGVGLILVYVSSTLYHLLSLEPKTKSVLRRLDHSMIYLLIAGSYTPLCLVALPGSWGWSLLGVVWGLALIGILIKSKNIQIKAWLSTIVYLAMGWLILIAFVPLFKVLSTAGIFWLFAGGIAYTSGTIFFGLGKILPRKSKFWMHEIWHLFVMAGSFSHFWLMLQYVVYL